MQSDYRPFERRPDGTSFVLQIALGVFLGSLAAAAVIWAGFELRLRWEAQQVAEMLQQQSKQAQQQLDQANEQARQRLLADKAARDQAVRAAADQERANEEAKRAALQEANRKEAAWAKYYKPSPGCALAGQSIECSNEFIRAKRTFDQKYAEGSL